MSETLSLALTPILERKLGYKLCMAISVALYLISFLCAYSTYSIYLSCFGYAFFSGFACGILLITPVYPVWSYFSKKKSLISGVISACLSLGMGTYGIFFTFISNPDNLPSQSGQFPFEVVDRFPLLLLLLSAGFTLSGILQWLLISVN